MFSRAVESSWLQLPSVGVQLSLRIFFLHHTFWVMLRLTFWGCKIAVSFSSLYSVGLFLLQSQIYCTLLYAEEATPFSLLLTLQNVRETTPCCCFLSCSEEAFLHICQIWGTPPPSFLPQKRGKNLTSVLLTLGKKNLPEFPFIFALHFCQVTEQNKHPRKKRKLLTAFWILLGQKSLRSDVSGHLVCSFVSLSQSKDGIEKAKALTSVVWGIKSPAIHLSLGQILKRKALRSLFLSLQFFLFFSDVFWNKNSNEMLFSLFWCSNQACLSSNFLLFHLLCSKYRFWSVLDSIMSSF